MADKHDNTLISDDMDFRGSIEADHAVIVDGKFSGTLIARGKVQISAQASMTANISGREVSVEGALQGNILHAESVVLHSSAKVAGDISCGQLEIQRGAKFTGTSVMK